MRIQPFSFIKQEVGVTPTPGRPDPILTNLQFWVDATVDANSSTWTDQQNSRVGTVNGATYDTTDPTFYTFGGPNQGDEVTWDNSGGVFDFSAWTISMWLRFANDNDVNFCVGSQRETTGAQTRFSLHVNPNDDIIGIYLGPNGFKRNGTSGLFSSGNWYFCSFASNSTNSYWYVNDVYSNGFAAGFNSSATTIDFGLATPNAGLTTYPNEWFPGDIAYCLYYDAVLTYDQHKTNYNALKSYFGY